MRGPATHDADLRRIREVSSDLRRDQARRLRLPGGVVRSPPCWRLTQRESRFRIRKEVAREEMPLTSADYVRTAHRAGSELAGRAAIFVLTVIAARRLSTEAFGVFMLGTTLGWFGAVVSDFGMQMHIARAISRAPGDAARLLVTWLSIRCAAAAGVFVLVAAGLATAAIPSPTASALLWLVTGSLVVGLVEFLHYVYRGLGRTDLESAVSLAQRTGMLTCGAVALWWRPEVAPLATALVAAPALAFAYSLLRARALTRAVATAAPTSQPWRAALGEFRSEVAPVGIGILLSALYFRIDTVLLEHWQGLQAVALYAAVFRIVDALRLFPGAALAIALPALCRATTFAPLRSLATTLMLAAVAGALALALVADTLVAAVYGPAFAQAVSALRILLLAFPLMTLNYALTHQLIGWNGNRAFAVCCAVALMVNLALNARLIPALSIEGAAWATVATELALTVGCLAALWSRRGPQAGERRDVQAMLQEA
jgi:O-antigen/teichoic acid export membrane protein